METPKEIGIFPNSGHHYVFLPLAEEFLSRHPEIRDNCLRDTQPWRSWPDFKWIRYRFGKKYLPEGDQAGLWVTVESNLGAKERGIVYDARKPVVKQGLPSPAEALATPYAFASDADLPPEPLRLSLPTDAIGTSTKRGHPTNGRRSPSAHMPTKSPPFPDPMLSLGRRSPYSKPLIARSPPSYDREIRLASW